MSMPDDGTQPEAPVSPLTAAWSFVENLGKPTHILVAISGGSDSTGLLLALCQIQAETGRERLQLSAVTVDHALRAESAYEAERVAKLCAELSVPHMIRRWEGAKPASGISEASRLARYRLIAEVFRQTRADFVVTGHTLGDQRETVAMRAARNGGSEAVGLSGMADAVLYEGQCWVMRPFLHCERQAIRDYVLSRAQTWLDDPSNENVRFERVRVRNSLSRSPSPIDFELSLKRQVLARKTAAFLADRAQILHAALARIANEDVDPDRPEFRHGLAALIATLGGRAFFPAAGSMERVLEFLRESDTGRMTVGRVLLDRRRDALYLLREQRNLPQLLVGSQKTAVWDDRFAVKNGSPVSVLVKAGSAGDAARLVGPFATAPSSVLKQAVAGLPQIAAAEVGVALQPDAVSIAPRLAPFDLFLPRFDLELANAIAALFGRPAYPQPPV